MSSSSKIIAWIAQLLTAAILGQTLFFKFTGAPEAVHIFSTLGVESWGRYAAGIAELITVILLLIPRTAFLGAVAAAGTMIGALGAHLGPLGIEIAGEGIEADGGTLFILALVALIAAVVVIALRWAQRPCILKGNCKMKTATEN